MDVAHLTVATINHLQWKSKLSDFFYGLSNLTLTDVPDHANCEFGKWLYSSGMAEFSAYPEMKRVEALHKDFHEKIKELVQMPEDVRKSSKGQQALSTFKTECDDFVKLLESIEAQAAKDSI
ncbi:MAG: hypothetical protein D3908_07180 [Candidatus Electrothrix sp. AUS4]|nr:hypothetical protein [Candidatus Electrothrix sp. AUS4]